MNENEISYKIRGAIFEVHHQLGPGLLESIYQQALYIMLRNEGLAVQKEVPLDVYFMDEELGIGLRLDLLVENKVIIEIKSVERLAEVHHKQLLTYLRVSNLKLGILVNFNEVDVADGTYRKVNGL